MYQSEGKHECMLAHVPGCTLVPPTAGSLAQNKMCKLRELILPCPWHHGTAQYIRSHRRLRDERHRVRGLVCHPYSACAFFWQSTHMALTFAALVYMPFQVFMHCPHRYDSFLLLTDLMSLLNILVSFATGYVDDDNKNIELRPQRIARHYLKTGFFLDLIGVLPLQLIQFFDDCSYPSHTIMLILKLFRLKTWSKEWNNFSEQLGLTYVTQQVITIFIELFLFFHWMTYLHYQVPCFAVTYLSQHGLYHEWIGRFVKRHNLYKSVFEKYTTNLFVASGLCVGAGYYKAGDDHLLSELLLTSFIGLAGLSFLTYTLATLLQLALYKQYDTNLFNGRTMQLKEYMSYKRLPKYLQRKIHLFINYKFNGHYFNEDIIMNTINEQVKQDINMYGSKRILMSVPVFHDMPIALINAMIFRLTRVLYMPGETLVRYGEPGTSLFMISSGTAAVINGTGRETAHLRDGAYFGETALLCPGTERSATILALEITEIYRLDNKEFQKCLQPFPHLKRRIEDNFLKYQLQPDRRDTHASSNRDAIFSGSIKRALYTTFEKFKFSQITISYYKLVRTLKK